MPGFDGCGPRGRGPLTGGGRGYCAVVLPEGPGAAPYGVAGAAAYPVLPGPAAMPQGPGGRFRRARGRPAAAPRRIRPRPLVDEFWRRNGRSAQEEVRCLEEIAQDRGARAP